MNTEKARAYGLCQDMWQSAQIVNSFDCAQVDTMAETVRRTQKLLITGEGSSRMFPAKHAIKVARMRNYKVQLHTDGGCQSQQYRLDDWSVLSISNSGRTAEVIGLVAALKKNEHQSGLFSCCAFPNSKLESYADSGVVLTCGKENAVAATMSVVEQALVCQALLESAEGRAELAASRSALGEAMRLVMERPVDESLLTLLAQSPVLYWAGPNDGVAEELTLKTNEIVRKPAHYLEGTYAVHGVEEAMNAGDVLIWVEPIADQEAKFQETLGKIGVHIIAISTRATRFPTVLINDCGDLTGYVRLAAGWSLLAQTGLALGINIDKPERARKIGNETQE